MASCPRPMQAVWCRCTCALCTRSSSCRPAGRRFVGPGMAGPVSPCCVCRRSVACPTHRHRQTAHVTGRSRVSRWLRDREQGSRGVSSNQRNGHNTRRPPCPLSPRRHLARRGNTVSQTRATSPAGSGPTGPKPTRVIPSLAYCSMAAKKPSGSLSGSPRRLMVRSISAGSRPTSAQWPSQDLELVRDLVGAVDRRTGCTRRRTARPGAGSCAHRPPPMRTLPRGRQRLGSAQGLGQLVVVPSYGPSLVGSHICRQICRSPRGARTARTGAGTAPPSPLCSRSYQAAPIPSVAGRRRARRAWRGSWPAGRGAGRSRR